MYEQIHKEFAWFAWFCQAWDSCAEVEAGPELRVHVRGAGDRSSGHRGKENALTRNRGEAREAPKKIDLRENEHGGEKQLCSW